MRAYYSSKIDEFLKSDPEGILVKIINSGSGFDVQDTQKRAWMEQVRLLQRHLPAHLAGRVLFEFKIPRVGKRVDVVLVTEGPIFAIEFKINANSYQSGDRDQAIDYVLDLKNFHETSHDRIVIPILVATEAPNVFSDVGVDDDGLGKLLLANKTNLGPIIHDAILEHVSAQNVSDTAHWEHGKYKPTPTISPNRGLGRSLSAYSRLCVLGLGTCRCGAE